jgi:hypothetical protein
VLALEERVVTHNVRISVVHEDMRTWRLRIKQLRESDRGCYMCQINASPMKKQIGCIDVQGESSLIDKSISFSCPQEVTQKRSHKKKSEELIVIARTDSRVNRRTDSNKQARQKPIESKEN